MNRFFLRAAIAAACALTFIVPTFADDHSGEKMEIVAPITLGDLQISDGFVRATLPNAPVGGGFLTIKNNGTENDTLIAANSDVAGEIQLHNMRVENDVMKMHQVEGGIPVPAGETVTLAPGGLHLMFMQLKQQLAEGTTVKVTLTFEKAGSTEVTLDVRAIAARHDMHQNMKKGGMSHGE